MSWFSFYFDHTSGRDFFFLFFSVSFYVFIVVIDAYFVRKYVCLKLNP